MNIGEMFDPNACNIAGKKNTAYAWTWDEYKKQKESLWDKLVLVDMIKHPVLDSVSISEEMFADTYPDGTIFALYCHSGWSSGYLQMKITPQLPQYTFVNILGGIGAL